MKLSELWLREWVDISLSIKDLSNQLTISGLEVKNIKPVADKFNGIVIGEIVDCIKYKQSDKFCIAKINIGNERLVNIVCNIYHCHKNLKVVVATNKSVLPGNKKIKIDNVYDNKSEGVLCSFFELGILDYHENIIELPTDAPVGEDIRNYLKLEDNIIEINISNNRADCLSIMGVARYIATLNKTKIKIPEILPVKSTINDILPIKIEVKDICPRYLNRIIKGVNAKISTPLWMKEKLRRCGIHSINVLIDVTNYVLLELGQPINIFDKDKIIGGIIVRKANSSDKILSLNGSELIVNEGTIISTDQEKILTIGSILKSKYSEVNFHTRNVIMECAFFDPIIIANLSRYYNLCNDFSIRYERGIDLNFQHKAIERATQLLISICGGSAGPLVDIFSKSNLPKKNKIILRSKKIDRLLGYHVNENQVYDILNRIGCNFTKTKDEWEVIVPSWRFDLKIEEDLIEEILSIYGFNNLPDKNQSLESMIKDNKESDSYLKRVKFLLNDKGYQEVINYSFVDPKLQRLIYPDKKALILPKPVSSEMAVMRLSLLTGLLNNIVYNQNRQQKRIRIFEVGSCFIPDKNATLGIRQDFMLAAAISGNRYEDHWDLKKETVDFYDMKGDLESILDLTGKLCKVKFIIENIHSLHPGQSASIYLEDEHIGFIGVLHPELERKFNLNDQVIIFELEWIKIANNSVPNIYEISRFPTNCRDISVIVSEDIPVADILIECKQVDLNQIVNVNISDVYKGNNINKGYKSITISLMLQNKNHTLEEREISAIILQCVEVLKKKFKAILRN